MEYLPQVEAKEEQEAATIKCCIEPWELENECDAKKDLMEWAIEEAMAAFTCPLLCTCLLSELLARDAILKMLSILFQSVNLQRDSKENIGEQLSRTLRIYSKSI